MEKQFATPEEHLDYLVEQIKLGRLKLIDPAERIRRNNEILLRNQAYLEKKAEEAIREERRRSSLVYYNYNRAVRTTG